jgi:alkylhydroperoxidase/carboxymuconolactone decarboxylase family protein YurZ
VGDVKAESMRCTDHVSTAGATGDPFHRWHVAGLDDKTAALVQIAALIGTGAGAPSYRLHVSMATAAGATDEEVLATLLLVSSTVGLAHMVAAAPGIALGLGYDVDDAFEGVAGQD